MILFLGYDEEEEFPVVLQDITCFQDHVVVHLETTAPPPKKKKITAQKNLHDSMSRYAYWEPFKYNMTLEGINQ